MDAVSLAGMVQAIALVIQACWTVGSSLYELQREKSEISDTLASMSDEVSGLRGVLEVFHGCLKKLKRRKPDEDDYQQIWVAVYGAVGDSERYLKRLSEVLVKIRGGDEIAENGTPSPQTSPNGIRQHLQTFRVRLHKPELERNRAQVQGHKLNLNLCLTMLIV